MRNYDLWRVALTVLVLSPACLPSEPASPVPAGSGTWQPGFLEIHHIDAGQGMAALIVGPTGRSMLVDVGEAEWDATAGAEIIGPYVERVLGHRHLDYVLVSHFHIDHVGFPERGGLWYLVHRQGFQVDKLLHRDLRGFVGETGATLSRWRQYLDGQGQARLHAEVARLGSDQVSLGEGTSFEIVAVDGNGLLPPGDHSADPAPPSENDYSVAAVLRYGPLDYFMAGDLSGEDFTSDHGYSYHDVEVAVAPLVKDVDVYRVSHHGSDHSSSPTLLAQLRPRVSILAVGDSNSDGHPRQAVIDRLTAVSATYLTERGEATTDLRGARVVGNVVVRAAASGDFSVAGDLFHATDPVRVDADGDGYFREADPDDSTGAVIPGPRTAD